MSFPVDSESVLTPNIPEPEGNQPWEIFLPGGFYVCCQADACEPYGWSWHVSEEQRDGGGRRVLGMGVTVTWNVATFVAISFYRGLQIERAASLSKLVAAHSCQKQEILFPGTGSIEWGPEDLTAEYHWAVREFVRSKNGIWYLIRSHEENRNDAVDSAVSFYKDLLLSRAQLPIEKIAMPAGLSGVLTVVPPVQSDCEETESDSEPSLSEPPVPEVSDT